MKKTSRIVIGVFSTIIIGSIIAVILQITNVTDFREWGHKDYYVHIMKDGENKSLVIDGDSEWNHYYKMKAYNGDGKEIEVEFYANKNLRKGSYISVDTYSQSTDKVNSIHKYEEVKGEDLPSKVKEKLEIDN